TVGQIPSEDYRDSGQIAVAAGQARGGKGSDALAAARSLPETTRAAAHTDIAIAQAQRGDIGGAVKTAGLIQLPGNEAHARTELARACARGGNVAQALSIANALTFDEYRRAAVKAVAEVQAARGDLAGAMAT